MDWLEDDPTEIGWYAVVYCFDPHEGMFPTANYWDGTAWRHRGPIILRSPNTFPDMTTASDWARAHDPERLA